MKKQCFMVLGLVILMCACIDQDTCEEIEEDDIKDMCYSSIAMVDGNDTLCDKIQNDTVKDLCYQTIAYTTEDPNVCDRLQEPDKREECLREIIGVNATTK